MAIRVGNHISDGAAALLRRGLEFTLGRFSPRLRLVAARITDIDGPDSGLEVRCVLTLHLDRSPTPIVIEDVEIDVTVVIARAADRAGRAVARALARRPVC